MGGKSELPLPISKLPNECMQPCGALKGPLGDARERKHYFSDPFSSHRHRPPPIK